MDSDLEAFSRNPTNGSFAVLAFQLAAFTKYLSEVFLSYCFRLLSQLPLLLLPLPLLPLLPLLLLSLLP